MGPLDKDMLESAKSGPRRMGRKDLINYLSGNRLTQREAIYAKCYDCDGMGSTGLCSIITCSLYPYSCYKSSEPQGRLDKGQNE